MDTKVAFKMPETSLGVSDLCNRGESILSGYKNEISQQHAEIKKLKADIKSKEESLRQKNMLIREQDAQITRLEEKGVVGTEKNGHCKNCDELRTALEEFQELIEKDFNLDSIKALLVEKDKKLAEVEKRLAESERKSAESVESLEEWKLKVTSARNETFTLKKEVRDLKRRIEIDDERSLVFTNEYISSCKESLQAALESVAEANPAEENDVLGKMRTRTATLCSYFNQLLGHCSTCSRQEQDSGIEESDSEKRTKSKNIPEVCSDCKRLKERYVALCNVNDRLVEALVKYEDMTLMLKVTSQDKLLWGPSFLRVMKMISNLNMPPCMDSFARNWQAMIAPQLERLNVKVKERASRGRDRSCTDSSAAESSPQGRKRKRRLSNSTDTASASEVEPIQKKQKTAPLTGEAGTLQMPENVSLSRSSTPAVRTQTPVSRSQTPLSSQSTIIAGNISVKLESNDEPDATQNDMPNDTMRGEMSIASNPGPQDDAPSGSNENKNPYRIQPEILKKIQAEAPRIVEKVGAADTSKNVSSASSHVQGLMQWLERESAGILEQAVLTNIQAEEARVSRVSSPDLSPSSVTQDAPGDSESTAYIREVFARVTGANSPESQSQDISSDGQGQPVVMGTQSQDPGGQGEVRLNFKMVEELIVRKYIKLMNEKKKLQSQGLKIDTLNVEINALLSQWKRLQALKGNATSTKPVSPTRQTPAPASRPQQVVPVAKQITAASGPENTNMFVASLPVASVDQLTERLNETNPFFRALPSAYSSASVQQYPHLTTALNESQPQRSPGVENVQQTVTPTSLVPPIGQTENFICPPMPDRGVQHMPMMQAPNRPSSQTSQQTSNVQNRVQVQNGLISTSQQQQHNWHARRQAWQNSLSGGGSRVIGGVGAVSQNPSALPPISSHEQWNASMNQAARSQVQGQVQGHGQGRGQVQVQAQAKHGPVHWMSILPPGQQQVPGHLFGLPPPPPQTPSTVRQYQNIFNVMRK